MGDLAATATALGDIAKAKAVAAMGNPEGRTCAGCLGFDKNSRHCEPLRLAELCQKQIAFRVTMARMIVEMICTLANAGMDETIISKALDYGGKNLLEVGQKLIDGG